VGRGSFSQKGELILEKKEMRKKRTTPRKKGGVDSSGAGHATEILEEKGIGSRERKKRSRGNFEQKRAVVVESTQGNIVA